MKTRINFEVTGIRSVEEELRAGIRGYSTEGNATAGRRSIIYYLVNNTILRVQAKLVTVGSWHEIGTLTISSVQEPNAIANMIPMPVSWSVVPRVEKLVLEEDAFVADCGLAIYNSANEQLLILPGAFPHTVEIAMPFFSADFNPEYDVTTYVRSPF